MFNQMKRSEELEKRWGNICATFSIPHDLLSPHFELKIDQGVIFMLFLNARDT